MRRAMYALLVLVVSVGALLLSRSASADTLKDTVTAASYRAPASTEPMRQIDLATVTITLSAGQTAYLNSNLRFGDASTRILVDNQVECFNAAGTSVRKLLRAQNIYPAGQGALSTVSLTTRFLLTAATAGTYRCELSAWMRALGPAGRVGVTGGFAEFAGRYANTAQGVNTDKPLIKANSPVWTPTVAGTASVPGHAGLWQAPTGATKLSVFADSQLTTCYGKDKAPCPQTPIDNKGSKVRTQLIATQFKSDGSVCKTSTIALDTKIAQYVHHMPVYLHNPAVPVVSGSGCVAVFSIYVKHILLEGHPYYLHNGNEAAVISVVPYK